MQVSEQSLRRRIIPIKEGGEVKFRTVANKSGVQWASCNTSINYPGYIDPNKLAGGGSHGQGPSWVMWLFIIPGGTIVSLAFTPTILASSAAAIGITFAGIVTALIATMVGATAAQILGQALANLNQLLPHNHVLFVQFEKPCSEDAGVNF